jgi:ribosomal RNA-processing protein 12
METFTRVTSALEESLLTSQPQSQADKQQHKNGQVKMPPISHTLMDLVISISIYLPRESFMTLFAIAALTIVKDDDPQLQKKAYKLIPRLAESEAGLQALQDRIYELQKLLHSSAEKASSSCRRDRLTAIHQIIPLLPRSDLSFIPIILSEIVMSCKEVNEKARTAAFDLIVLMGKTMHEGGTIISANVPLMAEGASNVDANLEEYFKMVSAGLAGSTANVVSASVTALTRCLYEFRGMRASRVFEYADKI